MELTLRASFPAELIAPVADLAPKYRLERTGERSYRFTTSSAKEIGWLLDEIEEIVLR